MLYYNLPLFHCNVKIWKKIGFIEFENLKLTAPMIMVVILTVTFQVNNFLYIWNDISVLIMGLFMTAIITNSLVRIVVVMKNQHKFIKFMQEIYYWYREVEVCIQNFINHIFYYISIYFFKFNNDTLAWSILKEVPKRTSAISKFSLTFGSFGGVVTALIPLLMDERSSYNLIFY